MALTYAQALAEANEVGVGSGKCSDAAKMAQFCDANIQTLCGAVSPQLVWEGAQKKGLTFLELGRLAGQGWKPVSDLQWEAL